MLKKLFIVSIISFILISAKAPKITHISWGKVTVKFDDDNDKTQETFKDAKITPSEAFEWDWSKTGTKHEPGIQISDISDIIDADEIILTKGMENQLKTMEETEKFLKSKDKKYHILQTEAAVKLYNDLIDQDIKVAILVHSTC